MIPVFTGARLVRESQEYPALYDHTLDYFLTCSERDAFHGVYFVDGGIEPDASGYYRPNTRVISLYPEYAIRARMFSMSRNSDDKHMRHFFANLTRCTNNTLLEKVAFPGLFIDGVLVVGCGDHIELWHPDDFPDKECES